VKTHITHVSNFGSFRPAIRADFQGYITYHASPRYALADESQLEEWLESRLSAVRAAAAIELANRKIAAWQENR